jgi:LuxR family maltose regulon positive regulatory protein
MAQLLASVPATSGVSRSYIDRLTAACHPSGSPLTAEPAIIDGATRLSQRELEVLGHIRDGLSNREIAETLYVTVGTVKRHTNSIYSKLSVSSRTQALARARTLNLLAG